MSQDSGDGIPLAVWLAPLVFLIAAVGPWPYGYYTLLRLIVFASAAFIAYRGLSVRSSDALSWGFVVLALLYNPVFRVHFERETWSVINLVSAIPYAWAGWRGRRG